jgi:Domain of unknown function (DUF2760)
MDDITTYDDAQVGAAARFVHQGCKAALKEHFSIRPIREESEGSSVAIPAGYAADEYRLIGKISGPGAFLGTLLHHGWKTDSGEPSAPRAGRPRHGATKRRNVLDRGANRDRQGPGGSRSPTFCQLPRLSNCRNKGRDALLETHPTGPYPPEADALPAAALRRSAAFGASPTEAHDDFSVPRPS